MLLPLGPLPARRIHPRRSDRLVGGRYRLVERMGAGGMATVYRARDERLDRDVAVKIIAEHLAGDELFVRRFRHEAELCARLVHPNIVATLDAGHESPPFIVMELIEGLDAGKLLRRRGRLTAAETVRVVAQVCDGLAYAHAVGVVHSDVSLPNILIRSCDGTAKLADFGLACVASYDPPGDEPTMMGTPGYVAPEILRGAGATPSSDLYSLGAVAYRLLAGRPELRTRDPDETAPLAYAVVRMPPLALVRPDLPAGLIAAVSRATADEPRGRQDSVSEFRAELTGGRSRTFGMPATTRRTPPLVCVESDGASAKQRQ
jgi:serine/threonine-protein kinase